MLYSWHTKTQLGCHKIELHLPATCSSVRPYSVCWREEKKGNRNAVMRIVEWMTCHFCCRNVCATTKINNLIDFFGWTVHGCTDTCDMCASDTEIAKLSVKEWAGHNNTSYPRPLQPRQMWNTGPIETSNRTLWMAQMSEMTKGPGQKWHTGNLRNPRQYPFDFSTSSGDDTLYCMSLRLQCRRMPSHVCSAVCSLFTRTQNGGEKNSNACTWRCTHPAACGWRIGKIENTRTHECRKSLHREMSNFCLSYRRYLFRLYGIWSVNANIVNSGTFNCRNECAGWWECEQSAQFPE